MTSPSLSSREAKWVVLPDVLFNIAPILLLTIVFASRNQVGDIFIASEWAMTAAIFFGQAIGKLFVARVKVAQQRQTALSASILTLGLAPSLIVFVLLLNSTSPSWWLVALQFILFFSSIFTFIFVGGASEMLAHKQ